MPDLNEKQINHINTVVAASGKLLAKSTHIDEAEALADGFVEMLENSAGLIYPETGHDVLNKHYGEFCVEIATYASKHLTKEMAFLVGVEMTMMVSVLVSEIAKRFYELGYLADHEDEAK